jgi:hypothetical protein
MVQIVTNTKTSAHDATESGAASDLVTCTPQQSDASEEAVVQAGHVLAEKHSAETRLEPREASNGKELTLHIAEGLGGTIIVHQFCALQERWHQVVINVLQGLGGNLVTNPHESKYFC